MMFLGSANPEVARRLAVTIIAYLPCRFLLRTLQPLTIRECIARGLAVLARQRAMFAAI